MYRAKYRLAGTKVHTDVALKVFRGAGALPKKLLDRLLAEVRLGASVHHANCVTLYGVVSLPRHGPAIVRARAPGGEQNACCFELAQRQGRRGWACSAF